MRKILILATLTCLCVWGCKKDKKTNTDPEDFDKSNSIFRVITKSDMKYQISIIEINTSSKTDTVQNITSNSPADFNYGFTPKVGSHVIVSSNAPNAKLLDCTIVYKGVRLGLDSVKKSENSLNVKFDYQVKN